MKYENGSISGFKILLDTILRRRSYANMTELLLQLAGLMDWNHSQSRKKMIDIAIHPKFREDEGWMNFRNHQELVQIGYLEAKAVLQSC